MAYNEQALKYLQEAGAGQLSEESLAWRKDVIYHGSENWFYACTDGGYMSPHDIYDEAEANAINAAFNLIEGFFSDYSRFREVW